jgi:hypothetical protein
VIWHKTRRGKSAVRTPLIVAALVSSALVWALTAGCADAPITAADLQDDGQLREQADQQQSVHAASSHKPKAQLAEHLRVTGLVATEAEGPLEDATRFSLDSEAIHLHLRADGLDEPRPVTFVWLHGDQRRETLGFLQPSETISPVASLPLARYVEEGFAVPLSEGSEGSDGPDFDPTSLVGPWEVEVYSTDATGRSLVFEREFEILDAESYEAWRLSTGLAAGPAADLAAPPA